MSQDLLLRVLAKLQCVLCNLFQTIKEMALAEIRKKKAKKEIQTKNYFKIDIA